MKTRYVQDLLPGESLEKETFVVVASTKAEDKNRQPYWDLTLADKTGEISAKIWSDTARKLTSNDVRAGKLIQVAAKVEEFKGKTQLNISAVQTADETRLDEYIRSSRFDTDEMLNRLQKILEENIVKSELKQMWANFFGRSELVSKLKVWPAGVSLHHEFRGGLLQHILEIMMMALPAKEFYPELDFEIVVSGIVLHDIGKLFELDASGIVSTYSIEGNLLGHVYMGARFVDEIYPASGDLALKLHLQHIVLSHHGEKALGAAVLPATGEAMLVHKLDDASAKARYMADYAAQLGGSIQYDRRHDRMIWGGKLAGSKIEAAAPVTEDDSAEADLVFSI